jgi:hypothetical protein
MKRLTITQTLAILAVVFCGWRCDELVTPPGGATSEVVYFTSFEKDVDTSGLRGYGHLQLRNEAPPKGGNRSLFVFGGCIWPHGSIGLKPLDHDSRLMIRCWGKNLGIGGSVSLGIDDFRKSIHITVQNQEWTAYESSDTRFYPAGSKLSLSVGAGGIAPSAMLVDLIEVRIVR